MPQLQAHQLAARDRVLVMWTPARTGGQKQRKGLAPSVSPRETALGAMGSFQLYVQCGYIVRSPSLRETRRAPEVFRQRQAGGFRKGTRGLRLRGDARQTCCLSPIRAAVRARPASTEEAAEKEAAAPKARAVNAVAEQAAAAIRAVAAEKAAAG